MSRDDDNLREALRAVATEVNAYFAELRGESPRAASILAMASLENELEALLRSRFRPGISNAIWSRIAGPGFKPLSSLRAKADFGQAFGFYGPVTRSIILRAATVRNKFAHRTNVRHFDHPVILKELTKLALKNPFFDEHCDENSPPEHLRWYYIHTIEELEGRLAKIRAHHPSFDVPPPDPLP